MGVSTARGAWDNIRGAAPGQGGGLRARAPMLRCPTGAARVEGPLAPCYRCKARLANGSSLSPPSPLSHSLLVHRSPLPIDRILTPIHLLLSSPAPFRTISRSFWCTVHAASLLQSFLFYSSCSSPQSVLTIIAPSFTQENL